MYAVEVAKIVMKRDKKSSDLSVGTKFSLPTAKFEIKRDFLFYQYNLPFSLWHLYTKYTGL